MDNEHCLLVYALALRKVVYIWQTRKNPGLNRRVFYGLSDKVELILSLSVRTELCEHKHGTVYARDAKLNG